MTTRPDFPMIQDLHAKFKPAQTGIISQTEEQLVMDALEIPKRTDIELQNCRDMAVMLYSQWADAAKGTGGLPGVMAEMDAMSAVTGVIDKEKGRRGLPV